MTNTVPGPDIAYGDSTWTFISWSLLSHGKTNDFVMSCNMFCWDTEDTEEAGSDFAEKLTFAAYFELRISDPG